MSCIKNYWTEKIIKGTLQTINPEKNKQKKQNWRNCTRKTKLLETKRICFFFFLVTNEWRNKEFKS